MATLRLLKPKRRWMQFSVRTGFVVVTVLCIVLGTWVERSERQRRTVATIEKLGGNVRYVKPAAHDTFPAIYLRRWLPPDYFDGIDFVNLANTEVTDDVLAHVRGLVDLQELYLDGTQVSDGGLAYLQGLTGAWLANTQFTDAGLAHLQGLPGLQTLDLRKTQVTDGGLAHLQRLTDLQSLRLSNTKVTGAGVAELRKAVPNCRITGP